MKESVKVSVSRTFTRTENKTKVGNYFQEKGPQPERFTSQFLLITSTEVLYDQELNSIS